MTTLEKYIAWSIYAGALEGRKKREHQATTRTSEWLVALQSYARQLGDQGLTL